jgi:regulator of cell morphogenesis and NO signaling
MVAINTGKTVGQLVVERPARARVFERLGIDYCCGGTIPLAEACQKKGLPLDNVLRELDRAEAVVGPSTRAWGDATMTELADHIEATHHAYLKEELPRLEFFLNKMARRHGPTQPHIVELRDVFVAFKAELERHMAKEEQILFPLCRQLDAGDPARFGCGGSVQGPISVMVREHDDAGHALERMRTLTNGYHAPEDACNTYRAVFYSLGELEADMHQHVHKENNILFPRAEEAEAMAFAR